MQTYTVAHAYRSTSVPADNGTITTVQLEAEQTVDLAAEVAAWINHDSPGCLVEADAAPEPEPVKKTAAKKTAVKKTAAKKTAATQG